MHKNSIMLFFVIFIILGFTFYYAYNNKLHDLLYSKIGKLLVWIIVAYFLYRELLLGIVLAIFVFINYNHIHLQSILKKKHHMYTSQNNLYNSTQYFETMTSMDKSNNLSDPKNPIKKFTSLSNNIINKENLKEALKPIDTKTIDVNTKALKTNTDNVVPLLPASIENTTPL